VAVGGHGRGQLDDNEERVLIVALEASGLPSVLSLLSQSDSVQLDAHTAGSFHGLEINFCGRRDRLPNGVQRRGQS